MAKKVVRKEITVCVTKSDIAKGVRCNTERCPIALAAKRHTRGRIAVSCDDIFLLGETHSLPAKAQSFVSSFDSYGAVQPFKFHLRVKRAR